MFTVYPEWYKWSHISFIDFIRHLTYNLIGIIVKNL